jgi:hypothetical protein
MGNFMEEHIQITIKNACRLGENTCLIDLDNKGINDEKHGKLLAYQ